MNGPINWVDRARGAGPRSYSAASPVAARFEPPRHGSPAPRWSRKLATIAGIDVYVHGTFLILIAALALSDLVAGRGVAATMHGMLLVLAVFATVVLHEFGHALTARRFGVRTRDITLLPIGGVARLEEMPSKPSQQLLVALAGPAVNLAIALLLFGLVHVLYGPAGVEGARRADAPFLTQLMMINLSLAAFNLLPGYPMDGGRVLRAVLAMRMAPERATQAAARVGQCVAVLLGLAGLFVSPFLMVIAVFVWLGARAEHSASTAKVALAGLSVRQGMITDFKTVSPVDPLSRVVDLTLSGFQRDFPVTDDARLVGVLTRGDLLKGLSARGGDLPVRQAMRAEFETVTPSGSLDGALTQMRRGESDVLVAVEGERVVGLLTAGGIEELLALTAAGRRAGEPRGPLENRSAGRPCPNQSSF